MPQAVKLNGGDGNPAWRTPGELAEEIIKRYALDFDAFADHANAVVPHYATAGGVYRRGPHLISINGVDVSCSGCDVCLIQSDERDGFAYPWAGLRVFLNPPYARGFGPRIAEKCIGEAQGLKPYAVDWQRPAFVVALLMWDTSTRYVREQIKPNAESIEELPRVQYELAPADLEAWRERGAVRAVEKSMLGRDFDGPGRAEREERTRALLLADFREKWATKTPDSPNFGSAVVVFRGPRYTVKGSSDE